MVFLRAVAVRNVARLRIADPDAAAAYRSLERALAVGLDPGVPRELRHLVRAVLRAYARALDQSRAERSRLAWATFVRRATLLYFALDRQRERHAETRWRTAAETLRKIARENADLIVDSSLVAAS